MIDEVGPKSIVVGGKVDENEKYVEPTVLKGKKHCSLLTVLLVFSAVVIERRCVRTSNDLQHQRLMFSILLNQQIKKPSYLSHFFTYSLFFSPLKDVSMNSKVMTEEIFGPLLPVLKYKDINAVIKHIKENEKPLTLYIFARNRRLIDRYFLFSIFLLCISSVFA